MYVHTYICNRAYKTRLSECKKIATFCSLLYYYLYYYSKIFITTAEFNRLSSAAYRNRTLYQQNITRSNLCHMIDFCRLDHICVCLCVCIFNFICMQLYINRHVTVCACCTYCILIDICYYWQMLRWKVNPQKLPSYTKSCHIKFDSVFDPNEDIQ